MSLAPLHKYLLEAFESNEVLRAFLVMFAEELGPALPDPGSNRETFTFRTLEVLRARGYFLDDALFSALAERDPRRRAQLAPLAVPYLGQAKADALARGAQPQPQAQPAEPLRVLFLAADPTDYDELDLGKEATLVEDALAARRVRDRVRVDTLWSVTADALIKGLLRYKPHVLHYVGHGSEQGEPVLRGPEGQGVPVTQRALARLLRNAGGSIQVIVLNACYTAAVAQELVDEVPVVVGMRHAVLDSAALAFAEFFYRAVAEGKDVRAAFELGRVAVEAKGLRGADLPQLSAAPDADPRKLVLLP